jgi:hypothetical protein
VAYIYRGELGGESIRSPSFRRVMLLEVSQYLENYLWPNFDPETATFEHVMSIVLMVNEKFRENMTPWTCFHTREVGSVDCAVGSCRCGCLAGEEQRRGWRLHARGSDT